MISRGMKQKGYADIVIGLQFGDEGKARVIDNLAKGYDIIARFNGGSNAGHTIEQGKIKVALHQIPSGIFYPKITLYIGSGCVVNIEKLADEIKSVEKLGIDLTKRLKISPQASIVQPHHMLLDGILGKTIGTTKHGIGPAYSDRAMRMYGEQVVNIRLADLVDNLDEALLSISTSLEKTIKEYKLKKIDVKQELKTFKQCFTQIKSFIELDPLYIEKRVGNGAKVLFEGAMSTMLDVTKGSVPFVTSSATIAAAAYTGGDLSPKYHRKTIGVIKAIMSRVGYGPFPSEFGGRKSELYSLEKVKGESKYTKATEAKLDIEKLIKSSNPFEVGIALRVLSGEYGATTQRPRRVGSFDLVQLAHSAKMNGVDELVITKCDLLRVYRKTKRGTMPIVTGYMLDDRPIDYVPAATSAFYRIQPITVEREAVDDDISKVRSFTKLPKPIKDFVREIEDVSSCKVIGLGVGPKREQYIDLSS
jgi:adenylosuccinate synthase